MHWVNRDTFQGMLLLCVKQSTCRQRHAAASVTQQLLYKDSFSETPFSQYYFSFLEQYKSAIYQAATHLPAAIWVLLC